MKRFFRSVVDIRQGEAGITTLMALNIFVLLVTYYFLKPARSALFLERIGSGGLPYVFVLIAVAVVPITTLYARASRTLAINRLTNLTTAVLIVNLLLLRWMIALPGAWVVYVFYIWVSIYGILVTSQFWLLANALFDATQAKRLFVVFGLAAIIGASTGGEITGFLSASLHVKVEDQLYLCAVFLVIAILLVNAVWKRRTHDARKPPARARTERKENVFEMFRVLKSSRYLMLVVGVIAVTMFVSSFTDYQFQTAAEGHYITANDSQRDLRGEQKQELGAFLGRFFGRMSLLSFLFQFLLSYRFIRFIGVGGVLLFLPLGLMGGEVFMVAAPGLLAGILLRGTDGILKYSIDKTARELLFLPVPFDLKAKTKVFIDVFVDRWFRGLSGAALALLIGVLSFTIRDIAWVVAALIVVWVVLALMVRREYVNAFRTALERRQIDPADLSINIAEVSTLETLRKALRGDKDRQIIYALDMLTGVQDRDIVSEIKPLIASGSLPVRRKAVAILQMQNSDEYLEGMRDLVGDDDPVVRRDAMDYVSHHGGGGRAETLAGYLAHEDPRLQATALTCIAEYGTRAERDLVTDALAESLTAWDGPDGEIVRAQVADALGTFKAARFSPFIDRLIDDPSPPVAAAAMRAAGISGDRGFVSRLFKKMKQRGMRAAARRGLAAYGDGVVGATTDYLLDPRVDPTLKSALCRLLYDIGTQHAADALAASIMRVGTNVRYDVIKALNKLRVRRDDIRFPHAELREALTAETASWMGTVKALQLIDGSNDPATALLRRGLEEELELGRERIFRLLQLRYPPADVHGAYIGVVSEDKTLRASGIEFIDSLLGRPDKRCVMPVIDNIPDSERIHRGEALFGPLPGDMNGAIEALIRGTNDWLKACAVNVVGGEAPAEVRRLVESCRDDTSPIVRETATIAMSRW